jgi:hypothetical protein
MWVKYYVTYPDNSTFCIKYNTDIKIVVIGGHRSREQLMTLFMETYFGKNPRGSIDGYRIRFTFSERESRWNTIVEKIKADHVILTETKTTGRFMR